MSGLSAITPYNNKINFKNVTNPNFKGEEKTADKSNDLSKETKIGIGVVSALAITGGITYAIMRKPSEGKKAVEKAKEELSKDWKEAMEFFHIKQLPEHIEFKEAKTLEEAKKYATEVLGIKKIMDFKDLSLDAMNQINKGIVDVSNAMKGRIKNFNVIYNLAAYSHEGSIAEVDKDYCLRLGNYYRGKTLANDLKTYIDENFHGNDFIGGERLKIVPNNEIKQLLEKGKNGKLNFVEQWQLHNTLRYGYYHAIDVVNEEPLKIFKMLSEKYPELNIDLNNIANKSLEEQKNQLFDLLKKLKEENRPLTIYLTGLESPYYGMYHELGHVQHSVSDYMTMNASDRKVFENKHSDFARTKEMWDKMRNNGQIQSWHKPILEFFEPENQAIAREVSDYATTTPSEFVAETFARKMQGYRFSDKVEAMYKKYHGPEILNPPPAKEPIWHFE